jgi:hypothetical protein
MMMTTRLFAIFYFISMIFTAYLYGELRWPLDLRPQITGAFAEYRGIHFHHGIDLSTNGKIGQAVYAADEGYVDTIMYQRWGIGFAVLLRHKDGRSSLYGHLDKYDKNILENKRVKQIEELIFNRRDFKIEFSSSDIPIKKGDLIGYSGETGIGYEHLHFELRDKDGRSLNPLINGMVMNDTDPPVIAGILIKPMDDRTTVNNFNGENEIKIIQKKGRPANHSASRQQIIINGTIGIMVEAYDRAGSRNHIAPYALELYKDGSLKYGIFFDVIERTKSHRLGLVYDYVKSSLSRYVYFMYDRQSMAGKIKILKSGDNCTLKIVCLDASGNRAESLIDLRHGKAVSDSKEKEKNFLPGKALQLTSSDDFCRVRFDKNSALYNESVVLIQSQSPAKISGLTVFSPIYRIDPADLCVDAPFCVEIKSSGATDKIGVYKISKNGKYIFFVGNTLKDTNTFRISSWRTGGYLLARDDVPPRAAFYSKNFAPGQPLRIYITDIGTGVDLSKLSLMIDSKSVSWDFDPDRRCIEILGHNDVFGKGKHEILISILDMAGNASMPYKFTYFVK